MEDSNYSFSIKDWSEADRPREKLKQLGRQAMSSAELIAILLGSGNKTESAVALAQRILHHYDHKLEKINQLSIAELKKFKGIGDAKAISLIAGLELGRRLKQQSLNSKKIKSSKDAFIHLQPALADLPHEEFWVMYLNNSNSVLQLTQLSKGGLTGTIVDIRLLLKKALSLDAVAIIIAHNHPSGGLAPSEEDLRLTLKIKEAAEKLDIKLLDHLILSFNNYFSFADEGKI